MTGGISRGPIRVECLGGIYSCGSAPVDATRLLTVLRWELWIVLALCTAVIIYVGGRIAYSTIICDRHERDSKILLAAATVAIVTGSASGILHAVTGG
ncbi:MAG: hypothetical protein WBD41_06135 [Rhodococcus sp. (in: high G+C Gram-positive bacteria)]